MSLEPLHANGLSWPSNTHCTFPRKASVTQMLTTKTAIEAPPALPRVPPEKIPMSLLLSALSAAGVLECAACSYLVAKLAGCWLRTLLHNNKLPFLRRQGAIRGERRSMSWFVVGEASFGELPVCPYVDTIGRKTQGNGEEKRGLGQMKPLHQIAKARLGAQGIGHGIHIEIDQAVIALFVGFVEPVQRRAFFAQASIHACKIKRRNVS